MNTYNKIFKNEHIFDFYFCKYWFTDEVNDTFIIKKYLNQYNYNLNELFYIKQKMLKFMILTLYPLLLNQLLTELLKLDY